jgi:hypothetical protein
VSAPLPPEQERYARWLGYGTRAGLALLVVGFFVYVLELVEAHIPPAELPRMWDLPLEHYLRLSASPTGWGWLRYLSKADYCNFAGIAVLALVTVACYARMIPTLLARGERVQALLAVLQVLVLLAAASGVLSGGH